MNRAELKELVREIINEESEYQAFFKKALEKAGKSITQMSDEEKKAFFNKIDAAWDGKGEKNEAQLTDKQKQLDVDGDGEIEASDLAALRAGKKAEESIEEKAPEGWEKTVKAMKDEPGIDNPWALAHWMKGKGYKSHKEAVELPKVTIPSAIKTKLDMAIDKIKDSNLTYPQKIQVVGKVMDSLGVDKAEFNKMASKLKGTMESKNKK